MPGRNREEEVDREENETGSNREGTHSGQTSQGGGRGGTSAREPEESGLNKNDGK